jgi:hypothetical protein
LDALGPPAGTIGKLGFYSAARGASLVGKAGNYKTQFPNIYHYFPSQKMWSFEKKIENFSIFKNNIICIEVTRVVQ